MRRLGFWRTFGVLLCGGVLLQTSGCGATLAPILANLVTSLIVDALLGTVTAGLTT